jgi:PAS domain S-box-containing protein
MHRSKLKKANYALGLLAAGAAVLLRSFLNPLLGDQNQYHTLWLAVVFSAWYCGTGPSIVTIVAGVVGVWYWLLPPYQSFGGKSYTEVFGVLGFLAFSAVIVALGESTRRIIVQRLQAEEGLKRVQEELEDRVRERTATLAQKTSELIEKAALLDLANDGIFVITADSTISYWNRGAERMYGWTKAEALGRCPHELLRTEFPVPLHEIESRDSWEGELRHTKRNGTEIIVASRWTTLRDKSGTAVGWLEINTDITSRKRAENSARRLSGRLLTLQDEERRRIARELHDSVGQYLAALKMNLDLLAAANTEQAKLVSECAEITEKCLTETRTVSYLLHPPLLDEAGFGAAASWYVEGFAKRSGTKVNFDLPPQLGRLNHEIEIALFRTLQEALTNVHRHSWSSVVGIRLSQENKHLRLEITDNGKGIPQDQMYRLLEGTADVGVGIAGMRERIRQLGGCLQIQSDTAGTKIVVTTPLFDNLQSDSKGLGDSVQDVFVA